MTTSNARVCALSHRQLHRLVSRCVGYEFEDVICEIDDVRMLVPDPAVFFTLRQKLANQLAKRSCLLHLDAGAVRLEIDRDYDLFFAVCMFPRDLLLVESLRGWKKRCRISVCWLEEIWAGELKRLKGHLKILSQFDYVVLNCSGSVGAVAGAIKKPCCYVPPGVDAIGFCPHPDAPMRAIDVFNLGRRSPVTHAALLRMAEERRIFYMYDTIHRLHTLEPKEHRFLIANLAKRSRYFLANVAKSDRQFETRGQEEIGFRFFEGAAAGTVMIGEPPNNDAFRNNFDWPDAVISVPYHAENIAEILADLDSQPERLGEIRKNSVVQSLLRHDWAYRWRAILDMIGLEPRAALIRREERLKKLARQVESQSDPTEKISAKWRNR